MKNIFILLSSCVFFPAFAQQNFGEIHGEFQSDSQYYLEDSAIGAPNTPEKIRSNNYAFINYQRDKFSAGMRYEYYAPQLQGYDTRFKGSGVPYRFARYQNNLIDVTAGNYYEQFGSGILLRTYEERGLGYDNSLDGLRAIVKPHKSLTVKGLVGQQRFFFSKGRGVVRGGDAEFNLNELNDSLAQLPLKAIFGVSFVSKYEADDDPSNILPENVGSAAGRMQLAYKDFSFFTEIAHKINDPSASNNYIYKNGNALFASIAYSTKGIGVSLAAKRIDNFFYRSEIASLGNVLLINYVPSLTKQHTYNLISSLYPYASQLNGEQGYQLDVNGKIKSNNKFLNGLQWSINHSNSYGLDTTQLRLTDGSEDPDGYKSSFSNLGKQYFSDFNIELSKKITTNLSVQVMYANLFYEGDIQQNGVKGKVYVNDFGVEVNTKLSKKLNLKSQVELLLTQQDRGHWIGWIEELTFSPHYFAAISLQHDFVEFGQWNKYSIEKSIKGTPTKINRLVYPFFTVGYTQGSTRIAVAYGKQRAGLFCVGGVCRVVPASNGFSINLSTNF
jgi:Family of unknown function (DUF6029)